MHSSLTSRLIGSVAPVPVAVSTMRVKYPVGNQSSCGRTSWAMPRPSRLPTRTPPRTISSCRSTREGAFINFDCVIIDTCLVTIGARTLFGPKVSLYSGTHPLDPAVRKGLEGPESGKEIHIGEDCWLAGNVTVLPGVTIGKGAVIG
ncbi:hypothetical protein ASPCADRAFT_517817, partial [Aspergillus carbonarius ITEM 5010]